MYDLLIKNGRIVDQSADKRFGKGGSFSGSGGSRFFPSRQNMNPVRAVTKRSQPGSRFVAPSRIIVTGFDNVDIFSIQKRRPYGFVKSGLFRENQNDHFPLAVVGLFGKITPSGADKKNQIGLRNGFDNSGGLFFGIVGGM